MVGIVRLLPFLGFQFHRDPIATKDFEKDPRQSVTHCGATSARRRGVGLATSLLAAKCSGGQNEGDLQDSSGCRAVSVEENCVSWRQRQHVFKHIIIVREARLDAYGRATSHR